MPLIKHASSPGDGYERNQFNLTYLRNDTPKTGSQGNISSCCSHCLVKHNERWQKVSGRTVIRVPTFSDWQNSMIFPWFFQVFFSKFPGIFFIIFKVWFPSGFEYKYANLLSFIWTKNSSFQSYPKLVNLPFYFSNLVHFVLFQGSQGWILVALKFFQVSCHFSMIFIKFFKIPWYFQVFQVYLHFSRFSRSSGNPV